MSTSNIGLRSDGTTEQYAPPRVIALAGGGSVTPEGGSAISVGTPVTFMIGDTVPEGLWFVLVYDPGGNAPSGDDRIGQSTVGGTTVTTYCGSGVIASNGTMVIHAMLADNGVRLAPLRIG